jgi:hypothetical protein
MKRLASTCCALLFSVANLWPQAATTLSMVSGNFQIGQVSTLLTSPLVVKVTDGVGTPVQGVAVGFVLSSEPGILSGAAVTVSSMATDVNGLASTYFYLGTKTGVYSVVAYSAPLQGSPTTFTATATTGIASQLVKVSGDNQIGPATALLGGPLVVRVADVGGNPVQGITVSYSVLSAPAGAVGYLLTPTSGSSNAQGLVSSMLKLGDIPGLYRVIANSPFIGSVFASFQAEAIAVSAVDDGTGLPFSFSLDQNYPNPFNPSTTIRFGLPEESVVTLEAFTTLGVKVAQIAHGPMTAGYHEVNWRADVFSSGAYVISMKAVSTASSKTFVSTKTAVLLK